MADIFRQLIHVLRELHEGEVSYGLNGRDVVERLQAKDFVDGDPMLGSDAVELGLWQERGIVNRAL